MFVRKSSDIRSSEITPKRAYLDRREILRLLGMATMSVVARPHQLGAAAGTSHGTPLQVTSRMVTTTDAVTPYEAATEYNNFYEFGIDKDDPARNAGAFKPLPWSVMVDGECAKPGT